MRKRQKLVLIIYAIVVFFVSFLYVPYARYYSNGVRTNAGNYFRSTPFWIVQMPRGNASIDAELIIAQVFALTAIVVAIIFVLNRK